MMIGSKQLFLGSTLTLLGTLTAMVMIFARRAMKTEKAHKLESQEYDGWEEMLGI